MAHLVENQRVQGGNRRVVAFLCQRREHCACFGQSFLLVEHRCKVAPHIECGGAARDGAAEEHFRLPEPTKQHCNLAELGETLRLVGVAPQMFHDLPGRRFDASVCRKLVGFVEQGIEGDGSAGIVQCQFRFSIIGSQAGARSPGA